MFKLTVGEALVMLLLLVVGLFTLYCAFIVAPISFYVEAECLRKGYPKSYVTIGLERYCSTLDGSVTVSVVKADK